MVLDKSDAPILEEGHAEPEVLGERFGNGDWSANLPQAWKGELILINE